MINFDKPLDLPPQLVWKFAHEPELLGWTIRARNYHTLFMNCAFAFMAVIMSGGSLFLYVAYEGTDEPWRTLSSAIFFVFMMSVVYCNMTHRRVNCAYLFTQSGFECCRWKDLPKWFLPALKWLSIFTAIVFLYLATHEPAMLLGALLGPGGMGLMYLRMAHSKDYQDHGTEYSHGELKWNMIIQLAIATNREVVDLKYQAFIFSDDELDTWNVNIFCKKGQKEAVAKFIRPYLAPEIPFIRVKLDMLMRTDTHTPIIEE